MITALTIFHGIISVLLIAVVLLQFGKGAEAGLLMDSGASSILPQKGNVMTKITTVLAIIFLSLSLGLAIMKGHEVQESIFDKTAPMASPLGAGGPKAPEGAKTETPTPSQEAAPAAAPAAAAPAAPAAEQKASEKPQTTN